MTNFEATPLWYVRIYKMQGAEGEDERRLLR